MNGVCNSNFFCPLGRAKRSNIIKFQSQSQFQRFLYQTLCVFSQMKDTNISDGIFILLPGCWGCPGGQKCIFFKHGHVAYQIDEDDEQK